MILETLEVSQFSELTPFLVAADPRNWPLEATIQSRGRQLRHSLPIVESTQIFLGDEAVNRA